MQLWLVMKIQLPHRQVLIDFEDRVFIEGRVLRQIYKRKLTVRIF
jgi:hypothetical protein